jgi:ABC-type antimicrobial peptide transport system permease subunit
VRLVLGVAGVISVLLATGGLYRLVCYSLQRRMKEIGIRLALGATRADVFRVIVSSAARLTAAGVALGIVLAAAAAHLLSALLVGVSPTDPLTFVGIGVLLLVVALTAGYAAARQGFDVDPVALLRAE